MNIHKGNGPNTHPEVSSGTRGLNFGLSLYLHLYFVNAKMFRLARAFTARRWAKTEISYTGPYSK